MKSACLVAVVVLALLVAAPARAAGGGLGAGDRATLERYAAATWHSFDLMVDRSSGLPTDNIGGDGTRAAFTSPTNIASYLWATLGAREVGLIGAAEERSRIGRTLDTLARMDRDGPSGQFFNWYDPATGARLFTWPPDGSRLFQFLSTVDNGWLAAALIMVEHGVPALAERARAIERPMDFSVYYDPVAGQLRGGAWTEQPPGCSVPVGRLWMTCHHYDVLNTEPRIASYVGIAEGQLPPQHYFHLNRTFPPTCDFSFQETQPSGVTRSYLGVSVFEGHLDYGGMHIVPTWGGSMFEALMVPLLVPEEQWGPRSWGVNDPLYVRAQIEHGMNEAGYGVWGFSPSDNPAGGYSAYGVDGIGMNPDGYPSNNDNTFVDHGFGDCRPAQPDPPPSAYTHGVVTPHASFLALDFAPRAALDNLARLRSRFPGIYAAGGFFDSVDVQTGTIARSYLALDQGMVMAAAANALTGDRLQHLFAQGAVERRVKPLMAMEQFTAGP
jgi:hypothetical protein